eukprot:gene1087-1234_t
MPHTQLISFSLILALALSSLAASADVTGPPSIMTTFMSGVIYISLDLTTGQQLQNFVVIGAPSGITVFSLLQCSGDDYVVLMVGTDTVQPNHFNISTFNNASNTITTLAQFDYPPGDFLTYQYNSIDIPTGLAFSTYCRGGSFLMVFNMNNQTVPHTLTPIYLANLSVDLPFKDAPCSLYTIGAYDNSTQTYYLIGDLYGSVLSSLTFGMYSLATGHITYVDIPYEMDSDANLQQVFVYESIVYACIFQKSFTEVIAIDFATETTKSIFKVYSPLPAGQFALDSNGYIVGFIDEDTKLFNAYIINLKTLEIIHNTFPYPGLTVARLQTTSEITDVNDLQRATGRLTAAIDINIHMFHKVLSDSPKSVLPLTTLSIKGASIG